MIAYVRGTVARVAAETAVLDVGGIGLELSLTQGARARLTTGEIVEVPASMVVREDGWTLYGFADADERETFALLQSVKGVGPKVAKALLSTLSPAELRSAVASDDATALTQVPGIGRKGAQRLVLDLRDKLPEPDQLSPVGASGRSLRAGPAAPGWRPEVSAALVALGWTTGDSASALAAVASEAEPGGAGHRDGTGPDVGALLRLALQSLDTGR